MMKNSLAIILCVVFISNVNAETKLTEQDRQALIGAEYEWKGKFTRQGQTVKGHATYEFSLNASGILEGNGKFRLNKDPKGKWGKIRVRNFRRLTGDEWTKDWKVKSLSGDRCDRTHHCFVFDQTSTNYKNKDNRFKKLVQFSLDYMHMQS